MEKTCFCCKKERDVFSVDLTDGCLCTECYEKVKARNGRITRRNIGMYSREEIMAILKAVKNVDTVEDSSKESPISSAPPEKKEDTKSAPENKEIFESDNAVEPQKSPFGIIKTLGWTILAIVLILCIINPSFLEEMAVNLLNKSGSMYIEMVQTLKPFDDTSYSEAFEGEFDNNEWSYFKSNEKHIVQVISSYDDMDEEMITQFLLTPQGNDQFYIEPYAMSLSGQNMSSFEMQAVLAAIFDEETINALGELFFYGSFIE